uniref:Uncharacterized protein n=1 Tax=Cannabis sativa TaxID=3483 RepID=A0A803Q8C6_CANSA
MVATLSTSVERTIPTGQQIGGMPVARTSDGTTLASQVLGGGLRTCSAACPPRPPTATGTEISQHIPPGNHRIVENQHTEQEQQRANLSQQIREAYRSNRRTTILRRVSKLAREIFHQPIGHVGTSTQEETLNARNTFTMPGSRANTQRTIGLRLFKGKQTLSKSLKGLKLERANQ